MIYAILGILLILAVYGPSLWVRYSFRKHAGHIEEMPGTGGELAHHLVDRFELSEVRVEKGSEGDNFYAPDQRLIVLSPDVYDGKSVTAVSVAAHEVGHAIQFSRQEPISQLREKYLGKAHLIQRIGSGILMSAPLITVLVRSPVVFMLLALVGVVTMLASVLMYVAILPEEYDASFNKALPILKEGYLPEPGG